MKSLNGALFAAALLIGLSASHNTLARGFHHGGGFHHGARIGVFIGAPAFASGYGYGPYYYPPYYYPPAYYPPVVVTAPPSPPVYVERSDEQAPAASSWYYCPDSKAYYPNVRSCASPWQRVAPQPPQS